MKTKQNIQLTLDIELIDWLKQNCIKKSELVNKLLLEYKKNKEHAKI